MSLRKVWWKQGKILLLPMCTRNDDAFFFWLVLVLVTVSSHELIIAVM